MITSIAIIILGAKLGITSVLVLGIIGTTLSFIKGIVTIIKENS